MAMEWDEIAEARMREINRLRAVVREFNGFINRRNDMLFQVIEHARDQASKSFSDWKDTDDWLFSNFDITKDELEEIYKDRGVMVHGTSCVGGSDTGQDAGDHSKPLVSQSM